MNRALHRRSGVTLLEMMIVVTIIALMMGITFPAISSGIDTLRLNEASTAIVGLLNDALNRAERHEQAVEITISRKDHTLALDSQSGAQKKIEMPKGVTIARVLPEDDSEEPGADRHIMIYPGGTVPRVGVELSNDRNIHRIVRVDPITGVPKIEKDVQP